MDGIRDSVTIRWKEQREKWSGERFRGSQNRGNFWLKENALCAAPPVIGALLAAAAAAQSSWLSHSKQASIEEETPENFQSKKRKQKVNKWIFNVFFFVFEP